MRSLRTDDLAKNREVRYPHEVLKIDAEVNGGKETMHTWGGLAVCRGIDNPVSDGGLNRKESAEAIVPKNVPMEVLGRAERQFTAH